MAKSLSSLQKSEFLKLNILIFHVEKMNNWCELKVGKSQKQNCQAKTSPKKRTKLIIRRSLYQG